MSGSKESASPPYPATVVRVLTDSKLVINRGSDHGVKKGDRFLVYASEESQLIDPETGGALGYLEIVRGEGKASHVQPKITTIVSTMTISSGKRIVVREPLGALSMIQGRQRTEYPADNELVPFEEPQVGDKCKPI